MSSAPSPGHDNPFAPPAAPGTSHPLDVIDGAVRIENGTELPHRCIFCNAVEGLQRSRVTLFGRTERAERWVFILALTWFLAPLAVLLRWYRSRRATLLVSECHRPALDSVCNWTRYYSQEVRLRRERMPLMVACLVGPATFCVSLMMGNSILPDDGDFFSTRSLFGWFCLTYPVPAILLLLSTWSTPGVLELHVVEGALLLRGCGPQFLSGLADDTTVEPVPPTSEFDLFRMMPPDLEFRPVQRDGAFVVLSDRTILPKRCARCNSADEASLVPFLGQPDTAPLREYRRRVSMTREHAWTVLPGLLLRPYAEGWCRPYRWVYYLCDAHYRDDLRRQTGQARLKTLGAWTAVACLFAYFLVAPQVQGWIAWTMIFSLMLWAGQARYSVRAYDCDASALRVAGCGEPFLQSLEAAPPADAPQT